MINGNWEQVKDLSDILRIVSENIGDEFTRKVEEIFQVYKDKIEKLENDIIELRLKRNYLKDLNKQLNDYIDKNKYTVDYMRGMEIANDMIER